MENKIDYLEVIKDVVAKVLDETKDNLFKFLQEQAIPAIKEQKDAFFEKLKDEASHGDIKEKIKNYSLMLVIDFAGKVLKGVVASIADKADEPKKIED